MITKQKSEWGNKYDFPIIRMVESVIFPPQWDMLEREEMLEREYKKTHRIEQDKNDADRYHLTAFPFIEVKREKRKMNFLNIGAVNGIITGLKLAFNGINN